MSISYARFGSQDGAEEEEEENERIRVRRLRKKSENDIGNLRTESEKSCASMQRYLNNHDAGSHNSTSCTKSTNAMYPF